MRLENAERLAQEFTEMINPYCERVAVAGSIRRRRPHVNDIDLVCVVDDWMGFNTTLHRIAKPDVDGPRIKRLKYKGVQVDIYIATPERWGTLLLIRTGSPQHNIKLYSMAKAKGWRLSASGDGLFDQRGDRVAGETETSIFEALGLEFIPPEEREA